MDRTRMASVFLVGSRVSEVHKGEVVNTGEVVRAESTADGRLKHIKVRWEHARTKTGRYSKVRERHPEWVPWKRIDEGKIAIADALDLDWKPAWSDAYASETYRARHGKHTLTLRHGHGGWWSLSLDMAIPYDRAAAARFWKAWTDAEAEVTREVPDLHSLPKTEEHIGSTSSWSKRLGTEAALRWANSKALAEWPEVFEVKAA